MKWVDGLLRDGSYSLFKVYTQTALKNEIESFEFKNKKVLTYYAVAVCDYIDAEHSHRIKPMLDVSINQLKQFKDEKTNNFSSNSRR